MDNLKTHLLLFLLDLLLLFISGTTISWLGGDSGSELLSQLFLVWGLWTNELIIWRGYFLNTKVGKPDQSLVCEVIK